MTRLLFLAAAIVISAIASAAAQPAPRPVELADYYRVEAVNGTALSPDGRTVAFVRTLIVEAENRRHSEIWTVPADGSAPPRRLTNPAFIVDRSALEPGWPAARLHLAARAPAGRVRRPSGVVPAHGRAGRRGVPDPGRRRHADLQPRQQVDRLHEGRRRSRRRAAAPSDAVETAIDERFKGRIYDWMNARFDGRGYLPDPRDPHATPPEELFVVPRDGGDAAAAHGARRRRADAGLASRQRRLAFVAEHVQRDEYIYERADLWTVDLDGRTTRLTDDGFDHDRRLGAPTDRSSRSARAEPQQIIAAKQTFGSPTDLYRFPPAAARRVNLTAAWD